jgi:hypothetical protein
MLPYGLAKRQVAVVIIFFLPPSEPEQAEHGSAASMATLFLPASAARSGDSSRTIAYGTIVRRASSLQRSGIMDSKILGLQERSFWRALLKH